MAKVSELRELATEELAHRVDELDDQVFRLRLQKSMGQADAAYKMRGLRRDRARVKTLLRERELDGAGAALAEPAPVPAD
jgi:large subunit ribosomal protein L29